MVVLEVCVDSIQSALAAQDGGADRVELCSCLEEGGVTPSHGLLQGVCRALQQCRVHVLVRPRPGDFLFSSAELEAMRQDCIHAAACGAHGVVLGMLTEQGGVQCDQLRPFVELCSALGLDLTFHRAFDFVRVQRAALDDLISCGVRRVLTSGGQGSAMEGLEQISLLVVQAEGRISVMPGGGVTDENAATVLRVTGASEVHGSFKRRLPSGAAPHKAPLQLGLSDGDCRWVTDAGAVQRARQRLAELEDEAAGMPRGH